MGSRLPAVGHIVLPVHCLPTSWMKTENAVANIMDWLAAFLFQPLPGMQILGSQKLHFLDVLTAWVLDMNYIPSIRCILERFGGWKWSRNYPSHLWWLFLANKLIVTKFLSSTILESILEILNHQRSICQWQVTGLQMPRCGGVVAVRVQQGQQLPGLASLTLVIPDRNSLPRWSPIHCAVLGVISGITL